MKLRARKGEGYVLPEELAEGSSGLICLTGGDEGPLAHALARGGTAAGAECVRQLCELFGRGNVYVELQRHFSRDEEARNQAALDIARKLSLPLLATNGVCHARPHSAKCWTSSPAIRHHRTLGTAGRLLARNAERHLKSPAEMARLFADLPEAMANTEDLSSRLQFTLNDLGYQFPKYPVPRRRIANAFSSRANLRRHALSLWSSANQPRARAQTDRTRAGPDRKARSGRAIS